LWGGTWFFPAIFNIADTCVTIGLLLIIIFNKPIFQDTKNEPETDAPESEDEPSQPQPELQH
jgi:lipoprotein signal peptidase